MADFYAKLASKFDEDGKYHTVFEQYASIQSYIEHMALMAAGNNIHGQRAEFAMQQFMGDDSIELPADHNANWDAKADDGAVISMKVSSDKTVNLGSYQDRFTFLDDSAPNLVRYMFITYNSKKKDEGGTLQVFDYSKTRWNEVIANYVNSKDRVNETLKPIKYKTYPKDDVDNILANFKEFKETEHKPVREILDEVKAKNLAEHGFAFNVNFNTRGAADFKKNRDLNTILKTEITINNMLKGADIIANPNGYKYPQPHDKNAINFIFDGRVPDEWLSSTGSEVYKAIIQHVREHPEYKETWYHWNKKKIQEIEGE